MINMIATSKLRYDKKEYLPGQKFVALREKDAEALVLVKKAKRDTVQPVPVQKQPADLPVKQLKVEENQSQENQQQENQNRLSRGRRNAGYQHRAMKTED